MAAGGIMKSALSLTLIVTVVVSALPVAAQEKTETPMSFDRFGFVLAVPGHSAEEDTAGPIQSAALRAVTAQTQALPPERTGHPYKWPGILMIGVGAFTIVSAMLGAAGVEGDRFRNCRAHVAALGLMSDCLAERDVNLALVGAGSGLVAGGVFLAHHRRVRSPEIEIGVRRFSVTERLRF
jgi:hypothetical protein